MSLAGCQKRRQPRSAAILPRGSVGTTGELRIRRVRRHFAVLLAHGLAIVSSGLAASGAGFRDRERIRAMRRRLFVVVALLPGARHITPAGAQAARESFRDITREAGVRFTHHSSAEKRFIVESMSGGVALLDMDRDGLLDIYFVDSLTVATANDPHAARSALYRNLGGGRFEDVTDRAGVGHPGWGMGVCVADVDGDRREDLYVTAFGGNHLYRNNGDGTFADIAERAGVKGGGFSTGCGFADYDRDGRLDLFVSRYVRIDLAKLPGSARARRASSAAIAGAVRASRPAWRDRPALSQRRQRTLQRSIGRGGHGRSARLLRPGDCVVRLQRRWMARLVRRQRRGTELSLREPEGRHVQGTGLSARRRGQRGWRRAGQHGRRGRIV